MIHNENILQNISYLYELFSYISHGYMRYLPEIILVKIFIEIFYRLSHQASTYVLE